MVFKPKDTRKVILTSDVQGAIDKFLGMCLKGEIPEGVARQVSKKSVRAVREVAQSEEGYEPKYYISLDVGLTAYQRMLEEGGTVDDVLMFAANEHEEDEGNVLDAKHRAFYYVNDTVAAHDKHPVQKAMAKSGNLNRAAIKKASTLAQQLKQLQHSCDWYRRVTKLEEEVEKLKDENQILHVRSIVHNKRLDELDRRAGTGYDPKQTAVMLHERGYTINQIAETVGKHRGTVRRWIKESSDAPD